MTAVVAVVAREHRSKKAVRTIPPGTRPLQSDWIIKRGKNAWIKETEINSQSLEQTQVSYILQKYTLDKYTFEKYT